MSPMPPGYSQGNAKQKSLVSLNSEIGFTSRVGQSNLGIIDPLYFSFIRSANFWSFSDNMWVLSLVIHPNTSSGKSQSFFGNTCFSAGPLW